MFVRPAKLTAAPAAEKLNGKSFDMQGVAAGGGEMRTGAGEAGGGSLVYIRGAYTHFRVLFLRTGGSRETGKQI